MRTYHDVPNIKIDGDEYTSGFLGLDWAPSKDAKIQKQRYETDINAALERLANTWTGWAIITEIYYTQRQMVICPYHPTPQTGQFNAYAKPVDVKAATMKDTTALDDHGKLPPKDQRIVGTGTGSNTIVRFSSTTFTGAGAPTGPGTSPDEILLHEMIHALRQMQGRMVRESVAGNPGMDNYEEFAAITISNIYRSEKGNTTLRADHWGFNPLTGPTVASSVFKSTYLSYLAHMNIEQPRVCQNLRQAKCAFNPFL
ncbi:MAG: M91 family zinc metallopeptidase [Bryobacteraceae bacterium]